MQKEVLLVMVSIYRMFSEDSNAEKNVKIFRLGADIQSSVYQNQLIMTGQLRSVH